MSVKTFGNFSVICASIAAPWLLYIKAAQKGKFNVATAGPIHFHDSCSL